MTAIATHFGVSRETARLWSVGKALPELPRLIEIAVDYNVDLDWLATGRGAMLPQLDRACGVAETMAEYDDQPRDQGFIRRLVTLGLQLPPNKRSALLELLGPIK